MKDKLTELETVLTQLRTARDEYDILTAALQRHKASQYLALKNRGDKLSDKAVEAHIATMPDIQQLEDTIAAKNTQVRKLFDRRDILMQEIQLNGAQA